ncbi:MAG: LamG domain-containing protein [Planctomycetota bacterium]
MTRRLPRALSHAIRTVAVFAMTAILAGTASAETRELARFALGEPGSGSPERLVSKDGSLTLKAIGSPEVIQEVATTAAKQTGSTHAIRLDAGDGYRLEGLPEAFSGRLGIELWVRPTTQQGFRNLANYGGRTGLGLALNNDGGWGVVYGKATAGWSRLGVGEWVHLAVVQDGDKASFFVNGKPAGVANDAKSWGFPIDRPIMIGLPVNPDNHVPFAGDLDEIRVFTFAPGTFDPTQLLIFGGGKRSATGGGVRGVAAVASVDFSKPNPERGLSFDRSTGQRASAEGKPAWKSDRQTNPAMGWVRDFNVNFTDERFRDGRMPVVDVEALVRLNTWAGIHAYGDTASSGGNQELAWVWGGSPEWKLLRFQLDDAHFGSRTFGNPPTAHRSDGFDLRLFGANEPMYVHRVTVTGYRRSGDVDWSRLLRAQRPRGVETHGDAGLLMFERSQPATLRFAITNLALEDTPVRWSVRVIDDDGQAMAQQQGKTQLDADSNTAFDVSFDITDWPLGSYRYAYRLEHDTHDLPVAAIDGRLGVYTGGPAPRLGQVDGDAPDGFLYGLQGLKDPLLPDNAAWLDLLGTDILRLGVLNYTKVDPAHQDHVVETLAQRDIHLLAKIDPPLPGSPINYLPEGLTPEEERRERAKAAAHCERLGRVHRDRLFFYEIGNEPDLPFFYPGPVEEYAESFRVMRQAIHAGDDDAMVMIGGLCFHSEIGYKRAHQLIELLANDVDAWAYHAHGPGFEAERDRWEMLRAATEAVGKAHLPVIETETGVSANGVLQLREQARTAVEKFVYCMSKDIPLMIFFALHFGEDGDGYAMIERRHEPRPVVLAYRNIVQTLRGSDYTEAISGLTESMQGHRFVHRDDGRQTLVLWSTAELPETVRIDLKTDAAQIEQIDLMGNRSSLPIVGGVASLSLGADPIYLTWLPRAETNALPQGLPPLLDGPSSTSAVAGTPLSFDAILRPYHGKAEALTLVAKLVLQDRPIDTQRIGVKARPAGPDSTISVPVSLSVPTDYERLTWPATWRVTLPEQPHLGTPWLVMGEGIDLGELAGVIREKAPAVVTSRVWSERNQRVTMGASADWWMAWRVNGRAVYNTLEQGNQSSLSPLAHTFEIDLKRGWNTLEADALSGSQGWNLLAASPDTVDAARHATSPPDRVELTLWRGEPGGSDGPLATRVVLVQAVPSIHPVDRDAAADQTPPTVVLGNEAIENPNESHPDTSRWYGGPDDLSALLWINTTTDPARGGTSLQLRLQITDQDHDPQHDRVEIKLRVDGRPLSVALTPVDRTGHYSGLIGLPTGSRVVAIQLEVTDVDAGFQKQTLRWSGRRVLP